MFFEKGAKGGVSYISKRYSEVNNNYYQSFDSKQESEHIIYLDAINLCRYATSKCLLTSGFKWIEDFDLNKYSSNTSTGHILEVDLEYPKELRKLHLYLQIR